MAENFVSVLIGGARGSSKFEVRMKNEETSRAALFLPLHSHLEPRTSSSDLASLDLFLELQYPVHQPFRRRRASRHPNIDRDHFVDPLHDVVDAIEAAGGGA